MEGMCVKALIFPTRDKNLATPYFTFGTLIV